MTAKGPAVLLSSLDPNAPKGEGAAAEGEEEGLDGPGAAEEPRSGVAQMLYTRWIMSLRESRKSRFIFFEAVCGSPELRTSPALWDAWSRADGWRLVGPRSQSASEPGWLLSSALSTGGHFLLPREPYKYN